MDVDILVDKKKYSFYQCLHYYYDYSIDGSTGGPLRFFDNNKIVWEIKYEKIQCCFILCILLFFVVVGKKMRIYKETMVHYLFL